MFRHRKLNNQIEVTIRRTKCLMTIPDHGDVTIHCPDLSNPPDYPGGRTLVLAQAYLWATQPEKIAIKRAYQAYLESRNEIEKMAQKRQEFFTLLSAAEEQFGYLLKLRDWIYNQEILEASTLVEQWKAEWDLDYRKQQFEVWKILHKYHLEGELATAVHALLTQKLCDNMSKDGN